MRGKSARARVLGDLCAPAQQMALALPRTLASSAVRERSNICCAWNFEYSPNICTRRRAGRQSTVMISISVRTTPRDHAPDRTGGPRVHTICQLQLRYWISAPCSASFCLCRMALALSSESSAAMVMLSSTGPIRGPTVVLGPPNHWANPLGAAASTSTLDRSTWPLPTGDRPRGESLSESLPDMVWSVG